MKSNRIIPCLDVDKGRVVKGRKFKNIEDVADPLELAKKYVRDGADELVFYDITASTEKRTVFTETIERIAKEVTIPFTVGGGIRTLEDIENILAAGADKVSINSIAVENPEFIAQAAQKFGSERVVLSMDVKQIGPEKWTLFVRGGQENTGMDAIEWAIEGEKLGAGELVVNSIDGDGEKDGYSVELTRKIAEVVQIPVVASGGAGKMEHFSTVLTEGKADAALAASVFHYDEINIVELKDFLRESIGARLADSISFDAQGLVPAIVQDDKTGNVLMLAYMNKEALEKTIETKETWFFSRSRQELWHKGATSGNRQIVKRLSIDCDSDAILVHVEPMGPACHTGEISCFGQTVFEEEASNRQIIHEVAAEIRHRRNNPVAGSYTSYLFREGIDKVLKKVGEESSEVIIGAKNADKQELTSELADLTYHTLVLMELAGVQVADVKKELLKRRVKTE